MIHYFALKDPHDHFDQVFAVSTDGRAVEFNYDRLSWKPLTPSKKLGSKVLSDPLLVRLDSALLGRFLAYTDPPRNFGDKWRAEQRWGGWVTIGLMMAPAIPLFLLWYAEPGWYGDFEEIILLSAVLLQVGLIFLFQNRLLHEVVKINVRWSQRRSEQKIEVLKSGSHNCDFPLPSIEKLHKDDGDRDGEAIWTPYHEETLDRGRLTGFDGDRFKAALSSIPIGRLRELTAIGLESAQLDRAVKLEKVLASSSMFGADSGYYVIYLERIFFFSIADRSWTQVFPSKVPAEACRSESRNLTALAFEEGNRTNDASIAQFLNLAFNAVKPEQKVRFRAVLDDGSETSVLLHSARWAGILMGLPVDVRDHIEGTEILWHFNDIPPNVSIYTMAGDDADPLRLCRETNWRDLPREVIG